MNALNPVTTIRAQLATCSSRTGRELTQGAAARPGGRGARARRGRPVPAALVPARAVRRDAPARDDRDGDAARAADHDHGRADHGARRRRAARHPARDRPAARRARLRRRLHHARPAAAARDQRPHRRDAAGRDRRAEHRRADLRRRRSTPTRAAAQLLPEPQRLARRLHPHRRRRGLAPRAGHPHHRAARPRRPGGPR